MEMLGRGNKEGRGWRETAREQRNASEASLARLFLPGWSLRLCGVRLCTHCLSYSTQAWIQVRHRRIWLLLLLILKQKYSRKEIQSAAAVVLESRRRRHLSLTTALRFVCIKGAVWVMWHGVDRYTDISEGNASTRAEPCVVVLRATTNTRNTPMSLLRRSCRWNQWDQKLSHKPYLFWLSWSLNPGAFAPLVYLFWIGVNAGPELWCGPNNHSLVLSRSSTHTTVFLVWTPSEPITRNILLFYSFTEGDALIL